MRGVTLGSYSTVNNTNWHHMVMVWDKDSNTYKGYVDGALIGTSGTVGGYGGVGTVKIGARGDGGTTFWKGMVDEVAVWQRELSAGEVISLYNTSLQGNIRFQTRMGNYYDEGDENAIFGWHGDSLRDYVGGRIATEVGGVKVNSKGGYLGGGTGFDAVNDYINFNSKFLPNGTMTISAWIYPDGASENGVGKIVTDSATGGSGVAFSYLSGSTAVRFSENGDLGNCGNSGTGSVPLGKWSHVVAVRGMNATNTSISLYVDGALKLSNVTCMLPTTPNSNVLIGNRGAQDFTFNGIINEVHVWNRVLSAGEVSSLYKNYLNWGAWGNTTNSTDTAKIPYYTNSTGELINSTYNGTNARYIQYRVFFETLDSNVTPVLTDVVLKQIDYKNRIFNTAPFSNFSLLYPANNTWINYNTTQFNITNASDLDNDALWFEFIIYNTTNTSILNPFNKTYSNYSLTQAESNFLYDGNYSWKAKLFDNSTSYDTVHENYYSSFSAPLNFQIDTRGPNVTIQNITANRTAGQVIINQTTPITYGENLTLRFNLTDLGIGQVSAAWIRIWQTVRNGVLLFFGYLTRVGDWWEITIPAINATYGVGQINYTIYANDTLNNTAEYDNTFYVEIGYPFNVTLLSPSNGTFSTNRTPLFGWRNATDYSGLKNYSVQVDNDFGFGSFDRTFNVDNLTTWYYVLGGEQLGADATYYWRVYYCDLLGYCNTSEVFNYTVDNTIPAVTLNSPAAVTWSQNFNVTFTYTPTDINLDWCILYSNWTDGVFKYNATDQSPSSGTQNNLVGANIADGYYNWNVICVDTAGGNNTLTTNRSIGIDANNPQINLTVFPTPIEFGIENSTINFTITDMFLNYSVVNFSYPNGTVFYNNTANFTVFNNNLTVLGNYTAKAYARDHSGRENTTYSNLTVRDTRAPLILLNYPENNSVIKISQVNFSFNISDIHSIRSVNITINGTFNNSISIAFNNISMVNYINISGLLDQQNIMWNISVYDNSSNVNISQSRLINIDSQTPTINNVNKTPEPSYPTDDVLINATIDDVFLQEIWLEGNWSGAYANYTNTSRAFSINSTTKTYTYNVTNGNFSNQQSVTYRWWANDSGGSTINTSWHEFKVQNRLPSVAIWRYPTMSMHMLNDNFTIFDWDNSTDSDLDNTSYELEVFNNTAFNSTYIIFAFNSSFSNYTLLAGSMPPIGSYYLRYRANDSVGYNEYNYSNFSIVYATLNIVIPSQNQILRKQNTYWFNVTELGNGNWISNASLELRGATFTSYINLTNQSSQYAYTSYGVNVTIPDVVSQFVTLYAYSWNGSIGSSTNNTDEITFRITIPNVVSTTTPTVSYFCPDNT